MGGKNLNVPPGKTDQLGVLLIHALHELRVTVFSGDQRKIQDVLPNPWIFFMDFIGQVHRADWINRTARKKDIKDGLNLGHFDLTIT